MLYKYSTTFLFSFLFLLSKIIQKRKNKSEKIKKKSTNKKILTKVATNSPMKCELCLVER